MGRVNSNFFNNFYFYRRSRASGFPISTDRVPGFGVR